MKKKDSKLLLLIAFFAPLIAIAAFICFYQLGASYLENWDEAWYAEVTKQLLKTKDFVVLQWNGSIFLDKPPLNFWMNGLISSVIGLSEFSVRISSAVAGFAVIVLALIYAFRNWGYLPALLTFSALALNNIFIWRTRTGNLDAIATLLIFLIFLAMISKHKYKYLMIGVLFGLTYLQKASLVFFPITVFAIYELVTEYKNIRKNLVGYMTLILSAVFIAGSWLLMGRIQEGPSFLNYFLFKADQGVASVSLSKFNLDYINHAYYSLQRRFFYVFLAGIVFLILNIRKPRNLAIFLFASLLLLQLSFTERDNNWYLVPSIPFWALTVGYGTHKILELTKKFIHPYIIAALILIPTFYVSYKTFTVNIIAIINTQANVNEVASARQIKFMANEDDKIMRLDFSYPVTIFYSDKQTFYSPYINDGVYETITNQKVRWVVGEKNISDEFVAKNKNLQLKRTELNDESIFEVLNIEDVKR